MPVTSRSLFLFPLLLILIVTTICDATHHKRAVPFTSNSLHKRNLGGEFKDWYLQKFTKNYMCLDSRRVVPVDPETGHMLLKGLRKRDFLDDLLGHSKKSEKGGCRNPTWVLPQGWTQPIPVTQFNAQYPWMEVDEYGQIHLKADYREWLEQQGAAKDLAMNNPVNSGLGVPHPDGAQVPDGGVGWIPPTALNTGAGMGGTSGMGVTNFGNGVQAGTAALVQ